MNFSELSDKQKAMASDCKTPEEALALAREEGYELSDEELEGVTGGWGEPERAIDAVVEDDFDAEEHRAK